MLSICTTIKNRSRVDTNNGILYLFPNCVKSIASSVTLNTEIELVITDWESNDWAIEDWIEEYIPKTDIRLITIKSNAFSAGTGRNIAAENANGDVLFFCDADMIVNQQVLEYGIEKAEHGFVYYPTVKYEIDGGKQIIHEGGGNLFIDKQTFKKSGGFPEYYKHGFEDTDFYNKIKEIAKIHVNDELSIFHQWHPQTSLFKNAYSKEDNKLDERKKFYQDKAKKEEQSVVDAITAMLNNDPNVTHNNLNPPVKGDTKGLIL